MVDSEPLSASQRKTVDVTVVVPVKNQASTIGATLAAIRDQTVVPREVVVVDGHSKDDILGATQAYSVRLITEDFGTRGGAIMMALRGISTEFVAFTDADCVPEEGWLERLLLWMEPGVVGVGGNVLNVGDTKALQIVNAAFSSPLGSGSSIQGRYHSQSKEVRSISGSNSIYRVSALMSVGGFDVNARGAEDAELNRRIRKIGRLVISPNAIVYHNHGRGFAAFFRRMSHYGMVRILSGAPGMASVISLLAPLLLCSIALASPLLLLIAGGLYIAILVVEGTRISLLVNLGWDGPILVAAALAAEHFSYIYGTWKGLLLRALGRD